MSTSSSTTTPVTTLVTTTTTTGNWWDSLGTPQYGGTLTLRLKQDIANFDPYNLGNIANIESGWMERLFTRDWTLDPAVFNAQIAYCPNDYAKGCLAQSWEFTDPGTVVVHLRQGVHWQNIAPANGREFIADDVVFHYDRMLNLGSGMKPSAYYMSTPAYLDIISVTATDKYTVVFKWKTPNPEFILETMQAAASNEQCLENSDAVKLWGDLNDWHHAIGTGPFILKDFVSGGSATLIKNPDYWGYDERYPQNHLPYIDTLTILIIPDDATALAGLRSGKLDVMDGLSIQKSQDINKTNPEIHIANISANAAYTIDPRNDVKPFNDIRVREAMQMAIDLPTIASSYYNGTTSPNPLTMTAYSETGWGLPYDQWPQDLKDQYVYNPTAAKKLLADAGYPTGFKTDIVADSSGDLDLLQIVKSYFLQIGIDMDIRTMDSASFVAFVNSGRKQDQLAQRGAIGELGFTYEPLRQLTRYSLVSSSDYIMVNDPVYDAFYAKAMAANSMDSIKQIIKDANKYVAQQHYVISLLQPNVYAAYQPWLKGYNGQFGSISGTAGITLLYFYPARFWIDGNLKKSMGG